MTCIVGIQHAGGVTIGADSAGSDSDTVSARADAKLFLVGPYLFGFTTSFRMGQLLHYSMKPPSPPVRDLDRFMATTFIDAVRDCFAAGGFAETNMGVERGGVFLVGVAGKLYVVQGDYQIGRQVNHYDAVGCGEHLALGSLHTTEKLDLEPKQRVRLALQAATEHSPFVGGPLRIKTLLEK
jgi:20S proteasome alpha/beta subunit